MENSPAVKTMPRGSVYLWIPSARDTLGGRVIAGKVPLLRLDTFGKGSARLWGQHVRVRNGGEINEPLSAGGGSRIVPIGDALPNVEGDFMFEPGRGGGRIDKVNWNGASVSRAEFLESGIPFPEPQFRWRYIQAAHFGEVNTYFHLDLIAAYIDGLLRELRDSSVRQAHHNASAIHQKFRIYRVAVTRGHAIPKVRKMAVIGLVSQARGNVEFPDEFAHCSVI